MRPQGMAVYWTPWFRTAWAYTQAFRLGNVATGEIAGLDVGKPARQSGAGHPSSNCVRHGNSVAVLAREKEVLK